MSLDNYTVADCQKREKRCRGCLTSETVKGETLSLESVEPADRATFRDRFRLDNTGNNHDTNSRIQSADVLLELCYGCAIVHH